jgi:hypothetical protein
MHREQPMSLIFPALDDDVPATEPRPQAFADSLEPERYEDWLDDEESDDDQEHEEIELPDPTDDVDAALQLAAIGEGPDEDVLQALLVATVYLEGLGDDVPLHADDDGTFVRILTDPEHAGDDVTDVRIVACADLVQLLPPDVVLEINPDSPISGRVSADELRGMLAPSSSL